MSDNGGQPPATRKARKSLLNWVSWPTIGSILGGLFGIAVAQFNERLSLPTERAEAAAIYGKALAASVEPYGARGDDFRVAALNLADSPLTGQDVPTTRLRLRELHQQWNGFQRVFQDLKSGNQAAAEAGVLTVYQHRFLQERLRLATNASQRAYTCAFDAVRAYGPGAPEIIRIKNQPEMSLRCPVHAEGQPAAAATRFFSLDEELDQIDSCTSGLRIALLELTAAMEVERRETPLDYMLRRMGREPGPRRGSVNQRWAGVERVLKARCPGSIESRRSPISSLDNLYPWQGRGSDDPLLALENSTGLTAATEAALVVDQGRSSGAAGGTPEPATE